MSVNLLGIDSKYKISLHIYLDNIIFISYSDILLCSAWHSNTTRSFIWHWKTIRFWTWHSTYITLLYMSSTYLDPLLNAIRIIPTLICWTLPSAYHTFKNIKITNSASGDTNSRWHHIDFLSTKNYSSWSVIVINSYALSSLSAQHTVRRFLHDQDVPWANGRVEK